MKKNVFAFTLVELTISMVILSIVIIWISLSLVNISDNFVDSNLKTTIFSDIKDFSYDSYLFKYSSWQVLTGGVLLYSSGNAVFLGQFQDKNWGYDYTINTDQTRYNKVYFWYFVLKTATLSGVLNHTLDITTYKFNDGKIYKNLILKDFNVTSYNGGDLFEINLDVFKSYNPIYNGVLKSSQPIVAKDYLKFNFNF